MCKDIFVGGSAEMEKIYCINYRWYAGYLKTYHVSKKIRSTTTTDELVTTKSPGRTRWGLTSAPWSVRKPAKKSPRANSRFLCGITAMFRGHGGDVFKGYYGVARGAVEHGLE